ncbi:MAG: PIN domain-containing protein [Gemmatimonadota bacterium]|nr:MAG: PIN domain-containing protein [Gemmatimonadota bacterium]
MSAKAFVDTNILVYAHDPASGAKHDRAKALVSRLWEQRSGVVSTQVLQELYVNLCKVAKKPIPQAEAKRMLADYLTWELVVNDGESVLEALELEERYLISFWDALIVQAANAAGVENLYSEDFNHGQMYGSVMAVNPFAES